MSAMFYLFRGITRMTGMPFEDIIRGQHHEEANNSDDKNKDNQ